MQGRKDAAAKAKQERADAAKRAREVAEAAKALQRTMRAVALSQVAGLEGAALLAAAEKTLDDATRKEEAARVRSLTTSEILKDAAIIHAAAAAMAVPSPSTPSVSAGATAGEGNDASETEESLRSGMSVAGQSSAPTAPSLIAPFFEPSEDPVRGLNRLLTEWRPFYAQHQAKAKANAANGSANNNNDDEGLRMAVSICEGPGQQDFVAPSDLSDGDDDGEGAGAQVAPGAAVAIQDDPELAKYFKMLKMHLPKAAVAMKMAAEGLDASLLDLDPTQPRPPPPLRAEGLLVPLAEKWLEKLTHTGRFKPPEEDKPSTTALGESSGAPGEAPTALEEAGAAAARDAANALTKLVKQHKATSEWLKPQETILMCGAVNKRGSKATHAYLKRVLVLTSQKRLVYLDAPPKLAEKGSLMIGPTSAPCVTTGGRFEVTEDLEATGAAAGESSSDGKGAAAAAAPVPRRSGIFSRMSAPSSSSATGAKKPARTYYFSVDFFVVPTADDWCRALRAAGLGQDISAAASSGGGGGATVVLQTTSSTDSALVAAPSSSLVEARAPPPPPPSSSGENPRAGFLAEIANKGAIKTLKKVDESNNGSEGNSSNSSGGEKNARPSSAGGPGSSSGGGRGDLLAQIAARGKKRSNGGRGGGNSQGDGEDEDDAVISDGPFPEERAAFQTSVGEFLSKATPQLSQLEAETSEMQSLCRRFCEYFGAGGAGGVGGSSAAVLANLVRFTTELSSATSAWERKHKCTIDDLLLASSSAAGGGSESAGSATMASGDVSVGHVVGTSFGAGVVEAVRFKDQIVVVQLDQPMVLNYWGGSSKKSKRPKRGSNGSSITTNNDATSAVELVEATPSPLAGARAFLSVSSIATLGRQVFTVFGPGTVRARAEAPRPTESSSMMSFREDATSEDSTHSDALSAASGGASALGPEAIKPRYVVELSWGRMYVQPKDVKLSPHAVPPSCRVAHRVLSIGDLELRRQEEQEAAQQAAEDAAAAEAAAIAAEYEAACESARAANQLAIEGGIPEEEVEDGNNGSEGEEDEDEINDDDSTEKSEAENKSVSTNARNGDDDDDEEESSDDGAENMRFSTVGLPPGAFGEDSDDNSDESDGGSASVRFSMAPPDMEVLTEEEDEDSGDS